jgi:hypothetical protein
VPPIPDGELPLPVFPRPSPGALVAHPALAAVLVELRAREACGARVVAYYEDAPYYEEVAQAEGVARPEGVAHAEGTA